MSRPLVTIAVPLYNGASTVAETIESALAQSHQDFELLVLDDGSSDDSLAIASGFRDPRIRAERFENAGLARSFNRCIEHARGRWLKILPQDDLLHPECLAATLALLDGARNPVLAFCRREIEADQRDAWSARWIKRYAILDLPLQPLERVNDGRLLLARWAAAGLLRRNCVGEPPATLFSVALARELGGFSERLIQNVDYLLWMRLMARGEVCFSERKLCTFRLHRSNTSRTNKLGNKLTFENLRLFEEIDDDDDVARLMPGLPQLIEEERAKVFGLGWRRLCFWRRYPSPDEQPSG